MLLLYMSSDLTINQSHEIELWTGIQGMKQFPSEQYLKEMNQDKYLTVCDEQLFIRQVCFYCY